MENKPSGNRSGRFWWLWLLCVILSTQIGLALQFGEGIVQFASNLIIALPLLFIGIFLHNKALQEDIKNNISIKPFRNIFLPWSKPAISLAIFVFIEFLIITPLFAYTFYPCSSLDVIRKVNGCVNHIPHNGTVLNIAFSKDGSVFATSEFEGNVQIWSYPDLILVNNLGNSWSSGAELSISSNGEMIAVCGYKGATSIFETRTGKILHTLIQNNDKGCDVVFTPDGKMVFTISEPELYSWDVATGKLLNSITQDYLEYLEITNDGKFLATGSRDGVINIRHVSDGTIFTTIQQPYLQSLMFSYDGKYLFTVGLDIESITDTSKADISIINVWNINTGIIEHAITLHDIRLEHISSSKNSNKFVVGDGSCYRRDSPLFETPCSYAGKNIDDNLLISLRIPKRTESLIFSPIDDRILIGSYKNLYIWQSP